MDRRLFTTCLALGVVAAQLAKAQQAGKTYQIGYLALGSRPDDGATPAALRQALAELGYIEGKNVTYVGRWAESMRARLPALAVELVALNVDVMVTVTSGAARAAKNATSAIPIVMALSSDPVGQGLIATLARPGGNVTGMSDNAIDLSAKRLELLKEAVPTASRIAVLWNSRDETMTRRYQEIERAAQALGVSIQPLGVREPDDFERVFSAMNRERPDAMIMVTDVLTNLNRKRVLDYAEAHRIPAIYEFASWKNRPYTTLSSIPGQRRRSASTFRNHCGCVRNSLSRAAFVKIWHVHQKTASGRIETDAFASSRRCAQRLKLG